MSSICFLPNDVVDHRLVLLVITVKMETLCSRFYADISGTSGDIIKGSSAECLESKN